MLDGGQTGSHLGQRNKAVMSSSDSKLDFGAVLAPRSIKTGPSVSCWVSTDTREAALRQTLTPYFRVCKCKTTELVSAKSEMRYPALVLDDTVQLVSTDTLYSV